MEEKKKVIPLDELSSYKTLAENRGNRLRWTQEMMATLFDKADDYVRQCASGEKTMTIAGWKMALGVNSWTWSHMKRGDFDSRLYEFLALNDLPLDYADGLEMLVYEKDGVKVPLITYSEFIENIYLRYQEILEAACQNQKNPVGSIFLLKSVHSFNDQSGVQVTNQTMNIKLGTMDEIETARKLLG